MLDHLVDIVVSRNVDAVLCDDRNVDSVARREVAFDGRLDRVASDRFGLLNRQSFFVLLFEHTESELTAGASDGVVFFGRPTERIDAVDMASLLVDAAENRADD